MSGRGRSKTTLSREQLQALNIKGNDCLPVNLEPPPTFPPLMSKPSAMPDDEKYTERHKEINEFKKEMVKQQFLDDELENAKLSKKVINYTDDNHLLERKKRRYYFMKTLHWDSMPEELRTQTSSGVKRARKTEKDLPDIVKRLDELAAKENSTEIAAETEEKRVESDKEAEDDELKEDVEDEEFDDDNDYGNNYFDNGEDYDDNAEEPLDDGPIY